MKRYFGIQNPNIIPHKYIYVFESYILNEDESNMYAANCIYTYEQLTHCVNSNKITAATLSSVQDFINTISFYAGRPYGSALYINTEQFNVNESLEIR